MESLLALSLLCSGTPTEGAATLWTSTSPWVHALAINASTGKWQVSVMLTFYWPSKVT